MSSWNEKCLPLKKDGQIKWKKILEQKPFIHPAANIHGDVSVGNAVSLWPGAVVRADFGIIKLGTGCNLQEHVCLHCDLDGRVEIGEWSLIGHKAMLHGCTVGRAALIGINCTVLDGAVIGDGCVITAGVRIRGKKKIPPFSLVTGSGDDYRIFEGKARPHQVIEGSLEYAINGYLYSKGYDVFKPGEHIIKQIKDKARAISTELFGEVK